MHNLVYSEGPTFSAIPLGRVGGGSDHTFYGNTEAPVKKMTGCILFNVEIYFRLDTF